MWKERSVVVICFTVYIQKVGNIDLGRNGRLGFYGVESLRISCHCVRRRVCQVQKPLSNFMLDYHYKNTVSLQVSYSFFVYPEFSWVVSFSSRSLALGFGPLRGR